MYYDDTLSKLCFVNPLLSLTLKVHAEEKSIFDNIS